MSLATVYKDFILPDHGAFLVPAGTEAFAQIETRVAIKAWEGAGKFETEAMLQLIDCSRLPIVRPYVAAMPDCHAGWGSTIGSVIPTNGGVIPSAVGVDIGCGMRYTRFSWKREDFPADLKPLRFALEAAIPSGGPGGEVGAWPAEHIPAEIRKIWDENFATDYEELRARHPEAVNRFAVQQLGTLGTGNHFLELTIDSEKNQVGVLLHSGSRGLGNRIGTYFSNAAKHFCTANNITLPHPDLAYFPANHPMTVEYMRWVDFAQRYAWFNRNIMAWHAAEILDMFAKTPRSDKHFQVNCHHNYLALENHFGENLIITRKGAVNAEYGRLGIIPGSMGAKSYIVEGLGNPESFRSCSHGAGRVMSRTKARASFSVAEHVAATEGVECCKTAEVIDETPMAYKDIEKIMAAQADLVRPIFSMKQFLCVKGLSEGRHGRRK